MMIVTWLFQTNREPTLPTLKLIVRKTCYGESHFSHWQRLEKFCSGSQTLSVGVFGKAERLWRLHIPLARLPPGRTAAEYV